MRLRGKVALVAGAAHGIGLACARRFAAEGASVMLADIDGEAGRAVAAALVAEGLSAAFAPCDVGDRATVEALMDATVTRFGAIHVLMSNVGITSSAPLVEVEEAAFDAVLRVSLKGAFLCGQAAAKRMIAQRAGGAIVNTSSVAAELAMPTEMAYAAAKGGVRQLTKAMALSLAPHGIRVNAVGPGSIETDLVRRMWREDPALRQNMLARTPLGRLGTPEEIANVALFLVSDEASYVTGQTIYADGGRLSLNFTVAVPPA